MREVQELFEPPKQVRKPVLTVFESPIFENTAGCSVASAVIRRRFAATDAVIGE